MIEQILNMLGKETVKNISFALGCGGVVFGNVQIGSIAKEQRRANNVLIGLVKDQGYTEREIAEVKKDIEDLKDFKSEVLKTGVLK